MSGSDDARQLSKAIKTLLGIARKRAQPANEPWLAADWSSCTQAHVFLDGWLSTSDDDTHLYSIHGRLLTENNRWMIDVLRAYSYAGPSRTYNAADTNNSLSDHIDVFVSAIGEAKNLATLVVTGYSLGGVVALIGLRRYMRSVSSGAQEIRINLIVPAISGAPGVYNAFFDPDSELHLLLGRGTGDEFVGLDMPQVIMDIGSRKSWAISEAREAANFFADNGTRVLIRFIDGDLFAPHDPLNNVNVDESKIDVGDFASEDNLAKAHIQVREYRALHVELQQIARDTFQNPGN